MPRRRHLSPPSYCLHKASGRAVVRINGTDHYLGPYGSDESHAEYERLIALWRADSQHQTVITEEIAALPDPSLTVSDLLLHYQKFAKTYYINGDEPSKEYTEIVEGSTFHGLEFDSHKGVSTMTEIMAAEPPSTQQDAKRNHILSAWELGRCLNELRFRLQHICLNLEEADDSQISELFSQIRDQLRELSGPRNFSEIDENARRTRSDWENTVGSEALAQFLSRGFDVYRDGIQPGGRLPNGASALDFVENLTRQLSFISSALEQQAFQLIKDDSDESVYWAFELGTRIDQISRPPLIERAIEIYPTSESAQDNEGVPPFRLRTISSWPDDDWKRDIEHFVRRLCSSVGLEPPDLQFGDVPSRPEEVVGEISGLVERVSKAFVSRSIENVLPAIVLQSATMAGTINSDHEMETSPVYPSSFAVEDDLNQTGREACKELDLTLDFKNSTIIHGGEGTSLPFTAKNWNLLIHFLNSFGAPTPTDWLAENWGRFSPRGHAVKPQSVHSAINTLNDNLEEFDVEVKSSTTGYHFAPIKSS